MSVVSLQIFNQSSIDITLKITISLVIIVCLWFLLDKIRKSLKNVLPDKQRIRIVLDLILTISTLCLTILFILTNFGDKITGALTGLGLISTALAFVLQDFIGSFFGWLHIRISNIYNLGDGIFVYVQGEKKYFGKVIYIGVFRTKIQIRNGDGGLNTEQPSGNTMSFPNHLVLKGSVDNIATYKRLWRNFSIVVDFDTDYDKTNQLLTDICQQVFENAIKNKQIQIIEPQDRVEYSPKVYFNLAEYGQRFTIWFAHKPTFYREQLQEYSIAIKKTLDTNKIAIIYPTQNIKLEK